MKIYIGLVLFCLMTVCGFSQDTYLAGVITGYDVRPVDLERPLNVIKFKGQIIIDKHNIIISKEIRKNSILSYEVVSIEINPNQLVRLVHVDPNVEINYTLTLKDSSADEIKGNLTLSENGSWTLHITDKQFQWYYSGITLKKLLLE